MSDPSTLEEFVSEYNELTPKQAAEELGDDMFAEFDAGEKVLQFAGDCWLIQKPDGSTYSFVEKSEFSGTLEQVATWLYFEWYVSECTTTTEWTVPKLTRLLNDWCSWQGAQPASADEILADICTSDPSVRTPQDHANIVWLQWFIDVWNEADLNKVLGEIE